MTPEDPTPAAQAGGPPTGAEPAEASHGSTFGRIVSLVLVAVLSVVVTVFVLSNQQSTELSFAGLEASMPVWLLILAGIATGALLVLLVQSARRVTRRIRRH
jgi:uncharacterized integral membrane protein